MKKLMIAAAIVCAAAFAQAASVTWGVVVSEFDSNWNPAVGNVVLGTGAQTWEFAFNGEGTAAGTITGDTTGIFASGTEWTAKMTVELFNADSTSAGQFEKTYAFTMPALTGDPTKDGGTLGDLNANIAAAFYDANLGTLPYASDAAAQGWAAAPEPTSGLLLLIGVAGLALKRKRA